MSKGGAFIYDPKLTLEAEIKACVKLQFRDRAGNSVIVSRIMQATQKPNGKVETRTLDSSMEKVVNGKRVQVTSRCADVDDEMISHLAVSKAVLNNVLFCHQEDSNWPLSEPKLMKKKFDAIFDASKYSKALENVKEIIKAQTQTARECEREVKYLEDRRAKAEEYSRDLRNTEQKIEQENTSLQRLEEELIPVVARLQELDRQFDQVTTMEKEIESLRSRQDQIQKDARALRTRIRAPQEGSLEELQERHSNYNSKLSRKRASRDEAAQAIEELNRRCKDLDNTLTSLRDEHAKLLAEAERQKERKIEISNLVGSLSTQLGLAGVPRSGTVEGEAVGRFLRQMKDKLSDLEEAQTVDEASFKKEEAALQRKIDQVIHQVATLGQEHKMKQQQKEENCQAIAKKISQLKDISASSASLVSLEDELGLAEADLVEHNSSVDISALEDQLGALQAEGKEVERCSRDLQDELTNSTRQAEVRGVIKEKKKEKAKREEEVESLKNSMRKDILSMFGDFPPVEELPGNLERLKRTKTAELEQERKLLAQARRLQADQEAHARSKKRELESLKQKHEQLEASISSVCGSQSYDDVVRDIEKQLSKTQEDLAGTRGSEPFFKMCIDKVDQNKKCPVCVRKFEGTADATKCIENLRQRMSTAIPRILTGLRQTLEQLQMKQKQLMEIRPSIEEVQELRSVKIPSLESEIQRDSGGVEKAQQSVMSHESRESELEGRLSGLRDLHEAALRLVEAASAAEQLDRRIRGEERRIPASARQAVRDPQAVAKDLKKRQAQSDDLGRQMTTLREEIDDNTSKRRNLEKEVHQLREQKLKFQEQVNCKDQLQKTKTELEVKNEDLVRDLESIKRQLQPLEGQRKSFQKEKESIVAKNKQAAMDSRAKIGNLKTKCASVESLDAEIKSYVERGASSGADRSREEMESTKAELDRTKRQLEKKQTDRNGLESALSNAEVNLRELEDSILLAKKQQEIKNLSAQLQQKDREMKQRGFDKFEEEYHRLQDQSRVLDRKKGMLEGVCQGLKSRAEHCRRELGEDRYKHAVRNSKHMQIDIKTVEASKSDLEKMQRALDKAIMKYHAAKMEEINEYIQELWVKIYKGNDIDCIKIKSEDDDEDSALHKRKTYKYRVVMVKGQAELDMRGRCSAGQKMLASIVIRLALAETFSYDCGVLALDEPTTNLDNENKEGLAIALADIVNERQVQRNFQLIVITHDDEFVEMLGRSKFVDHFTMVKKNEDGISGVQRMPFATNWR